VAANREHFKEGYYIHFNQIIMFKEKPADKAWDRILDAFIGAVEKENANPSGEMHEYGSVHACCGEGVDICQGCLKNI